MAGENRQMKKKIGFICSSWMTLKLFNVALVKELSAVADIYLICGDCKKVRDAIGAEFDDKIFYVEFPLPRKPSFFIDVLMLFRLARMLPPLKLDLLVSLSPKAGFVTAVCGMWVKINQIHIFQGEVWATSHGLKRSLLKWCDRFVCIRSEHTVCVSFAEKNFLVDQGIGSRWKLKVLGWGSIAGVQNLGSIRSGAISNKLVIGFLGRLAKDKGVIDLIYAFSSSELLKTSCVLKIVGPKDDAFDTCNTLVAGLNRSGACIELFAGISDPKTFFDGIDIFCSPTYREGFGLTILEAAAAKKPIISTNIYGTKDFLINGVTGICINPGDQLALRQALISVSTGLSQYSDMVERAHAVALKSYDPAFVRKCYVDFFVSLLR